jgi:hypothetical protein
MFFNFFNRKNARKSRRPVNTTVAMIEKFEDRTVMAANVFAAVNNGTLYIEGTPGDDTIIVRQNGNTVSVDGVQIQGSGRIRTITVNSLGGNDVVRLDANGNASQTVRLNSLVFGGTGNDLIVGGKSNDQLQGNEGNDTVHGLDGIDSLFGQQDSDVLFGGLNNDLLVGGDGNDSLSGGDGKDSLFAGTGADSISGGAGTDELVLDDATESKLKSISDIDSIRIELRDQDVEAQGDDNTCGPNSATRLVHAFGGIVTLNEMKSAAREGSFISQLNMGTTGQTLVEAMHRNTRGLGNTRFSLTTQGNLNDVLALVKQGQPVLTLIYDGTESYHGIPVPQLHWVVVNGFNSATGTVSYRETTGGDVSLSQASFNRKFQWSGSNPAMRLLQGVGVRPGTYISAVIRETAAPTPQLVTDLRFDSFSGADRLFAAGGDRVYWQAGNQLRAGRIVNGTLTIDLRFDGFDGRTDRLFAAQGDTVYWQSGNQLRRGRISNGELTIDLRFDGFSSSDRLFAASGNTVFWQSGNQLRRGTIANGQLNIDLRFDGFSASDTLFAASGNTVYWQNGNQLRSGNVVDGQLNIDRRFDGFDGRTDRLFAAQGNSIYWQAGNQFRRGQLS